MPVGSERRSRWTCGCIAATHRDLPAWSAQGRFREDLYYRLNVVHVALPPLRERRAGHPAARSTLPPRAGRAPRRGRVAVDPDAQRRLLGYDWPGNIRELQNVLERAMLLAEQDVIGPEHLPAGGASRGAAAACLPRRPPAGRAMAAPLPRRAGARARPARPRRGARSRESGRAVLGISRRTLTRMIQRWNLPRH